MSVNGNAKKTKQLGESYGTASHRLKKMIMFKLLGLLELDKCFQCGEKIRTTEELSVEHKVPWLDSENPKQFFFDLDNIAFSHLSCNSRAAKPVMKKYFTKSDQIEAGKAADKRYKLKNYTKEKRHNQYLRTGN